MASESGMAGIVRNAAAKKTYREFMERRQRLIESIQGAGKSGGVVWSAYPFGITTEDELNKNHLRRSCHGVTAERLVVLAQAIEEMATNDIPKIQNLYGAEDISRRLWLPLVLPAGFTKLTYQSHDAWAVSDKDVEILTYLERDPVSNKVFQLQLDVQSFLDEHCLSRDNVVIRRQSGSRLLAKLWLSELDREPARIPSRCILFEWQSDDMLPPIFYGGHSSARRLDKKETVARWKCYEFIEYPDGRPVRKKGIVCGG